MSGRNSFFEESIVLENSRVKLLPFAVEHYDALKAFIFDEGMDYSGAKSRTDDDVRRYVENTINERGRCKSYPFVVIDKQTDEIAGSTRYGNISFESLKLEIGWTWYGKKFRGSGLNKACKYELLKYGFEVLRFRRIQFTADIENIRSRKAIIKIGAKQEGILRSHDIDDEGNSRDEALYSIISSEWDQLKTTVFREFKMGSFKEDNDF